MDELKKEWDDALMESSKKFKMNTEPKGTFRPGQQTLGTVYRNDPPWNEYIQPDVDYMKTVRDYQDSLRKIQPGDIVTLKSGGLQFTLLSLDESKKTCHILSATKEFGIVEYKELDWVNICRTLYNGTIITLPK